MNRRRWGFLLPLAGLQIAVGLSATAAPGGARPVAPGGAHPVIVQAEIRGSIDPGSANYLRAAIDRARAEDAQALIVELDTPGGLVSSVQDMAQAIDQSPIPVVVYTAPAGAAATSAGALLSLASHVAAMAPGTHIGAAHPVGASGQDIEGDMKQKAANDTAAFARSLAELRGRPAALAQEVVLKSRSLTAGEAHAQGLVEILAPSRDELLAQLDGRAVRLAHGEERKLRTRGAEVREVAMTPGQSLLHFLANPNIATLLMSAGLLLLYLEFSHPGVGIPGVLGGVCLLVALMSYQLLPIRTGGLVLLLLGAALMLAEPFVVSHGALAIGGVLSFILGLLWLMDPAQTSLVVSASVWIPVALALGGGALGLAWLARRSLRLAAQARARIGGFGTGGLEGYVGVVTAGGKLSIRGETWDFECDQPVKVGDSVEVIGMSGMRARVRPVGSQQEA